MAIHPSAGQPAPASELIDVQAVEKAYYDLRPDPSQPAQRVSFGTSGHRGVSLDGSFNEAHILAITQAIVEYRQAHGIDGPLYMGKDTHLLSRPAERTALEVLAAQGVQVMIEQNDGVTPTPVVSHAILAYNKGRTQHMADGIVITPSHNPPADGGFKYNPPHGGPAESNVTAWIQNRANALLEQGPGAIKRLPYEQAVKADTTRAIDFSTPYIADLGAIIDFPLIRSAGLKLGVDPLGGAAAGYWAPICERYQINVEVVNPQIDPTFAFMPLDHDGKIRMDCSSPYAMARLVALKDRFDVAFGNDPDSDRHGIVARSCGLLNPNHFLAVAVHYLITHRPRWPQTAKIGKTLVSSALIDRVAADLGRPLFETPVGFKWFAAGLLAGELCFGGEESAGASFSRHDGTVWTTDKDGPIMDLLAAEMTAATGNDPGVLYEQLASRLGHASYTRIDAPATLDQKQRLAKLEESSVAESELAGEPIQAKLTRAPGDGQPIGGLKVVAASCWFAARPSGTEDIYKIYAESFRGTDHLNQVVAEAQRIVERALGA